MGRYDDIIHLKRPYYEEYPPMPIEDRAAQFYPFAAVVGYGDAVAETSRITDDMIELDADAVYEIDIKLSRLKNMIADSPLIRITYFVKDEKKEGGRYEKKEGRVRKIDEFAGKLIFEDGKRVYINSLLSLDLLRP